MAKKQFGAGKKGFLNNKISGSTALNASLKESGKKEIFANIQINPQLQRYIAPLAEEEFGMLENNILKTKKVRDPLVLWKKSENEFVLLDGHHRYSILKKHEADAIDWSYQFVELEDLQAAFELMEEIQLGRRNATRNYISYVRGRAYQNEKQNHGGGRKAGEGASEKTRTRVAKRFNVSERTIGLDATFAHALDRLLEEENKEFLDIRNQVLLGSSKLKKQELIFLGQHEALSVPVFFEFLEKGGSVDELSGGLSAEEMKAFIEKYEGKKSAAPKKPSPTKPKTTDKKDRFVSWYEKEEKMISRLASKGSLQEKTQKKEELLDRIQQLQKLVKAID